jgi:hypothetical protein
MSIKVEQPQLLMTHSIKIGGEDFSLRFSDAGRSLLIEACASQRKVRVIDNVTSAAWGEVGILSLEYLSQDMKIQICDVLAVCMTQIEEEIQYDTESLKRNLIRLKCAIGVQAPLAPSLCTDSLLVTLKSATGHALLQDGVMRLSYATLASLGFKKSLNWLSPEERDSLCEVVGTRLCIRHGRLVLNTETPFVVHYGPLCISCAPVFTKVSLVEKGFEVEVKHDELGEIITAHVDLATLRLVDPTLFSSSPVPDNQSQSHLGWMPMKSLKKLSQKMLASSRLQFGALCVSASCKRPTMVRFGTQGTMVNLSIWNEVLVVKLFSANTGKSAEVHVTSKCIDTWHRFGCPRIAWASFEECVRMAKSLGMNEIGGHSFSFPT